MNRNQCYNVLEADSIKESVISQTSNKVRKMVLEREGPHMYIASRKGVILQVMKSNDNDNHLVFVEQAVVH